LPPVIVSKEAKEKGLQVSLFERLTEEGSKSSCALHFFYVLLEDLRSFILFSNQVVPSVMLDIQYRMHPSISYFPSSEFYNNSIQDGTMDKDGNVVRGLEPPLSSAHLLRRLADMSGEGGLTQSHPSVIFLDHSGPESVQGASRVNFPETQIVVSLVEDLLLQNPVSP